MTSAAAEPSMSRPWGRGLWISAALLLAMLIAAEAALRTSFVFERLPMPRPYYTYDVTRRVHYLTELERVHGPIDVLFVGSSAVRAGFKPPQFDKAVKAAGGGRVLSFNGGLSKMYPGTARLYLAHVWLEQTKPRFVLHGIRPNELVSGSSGSFLKNGAIESLWLERAPLAMLEARLLGASKLLQYRGTLNMSLERWSADKPLHAARERGEMGTDSRGYGREKTPLRITRKRHSRRLWLYRKMPNAKQYERGLAVLEAMRAECERHGVQYVLVHLPEHPDRYAREQGGMLWQDYQARVHTWAAAHHVPFIDVTHGDFHRFGADELYSDYHHLSLRGAERLSELVAKDFAKLLSEPR